MKQKSKTELYRRYRPFRLRDLHGQESAVKMLYKLAKTARIPHCLLFTGPSGCGKTTMARIMRKAVKCGLNDFSEVNCADFRGIDMVRDIRSRMALAPMSGESKVWVIDECHKLTGDAQTAFLKMLEDTPDHVYFFLATTDPQKLLLTIRTRCTEIKVSLLKEKDMETLIEGVILAEKASPLSTDVMDQLIDKAEGSPRKALVLLHQIIGLEDEEDKLHALSKADTKAQAIQLARAIINPRPSWSEVVKILKTLEDDPESVRRLILGYASSVLKSGGKLSQRAFLIIDVFGSNFFDTGEAGLTAACYAVATAK
jgi:DNA polymerase-3 subunit gamma/tau